MKFDIDGAMAGRQGKDCGCPVSAALNSIKEEAEAAELYNKRANTVDDPAARAVYRDIAKEEAVHMGEAAKLLERADPELANKIPEGMEEAEDKIHRYMTNPPVAKNLDIDGVMDEMMERRK